MSRGHASFTSTRASRGASSRHAPILEVVFDSCIDVPKALDQTIKLNEYLEKIGNPVTLRVVYTHELLREQACLMDATLLKDTSRWPNHKEAVSIAGRLQQLGSHVHVLPKDAHAQYFVDGLLQLVQGVARHMPQAPAVQTSLKALGLTAPQDLCTLRQPNAETLQVLYNQFIMGPAIDTAYRGVPEAQEYKARRKNSGDHSVLDYLYRSANHPKTEIGQRKMTVVVTADDNLTARIQKIYNRAERESIRVMDADAFGQFLQGVVTETSRHTSAKHEKPQIIEGSAGRANLALVAQLLSQQSTQRL